MPKLALVPIVLFLGWGAFCHNWYVCDLKQACKDDSGDGTEVVDSTAATADAGPDNRPLVYEWQNANAITRDGFDAYRDSILGKLPEGNILEIVGQYFEGEDAPEGHPNMGMARAASFKDLIGDLLPEERMLVSSQARKTLGGDKGLPFEALSFNFLEPAAEEEPEKVEITEVDDQIIIQFPFSSDQGFKSQEIDDYLAKLAERLGQTEETVSITGHTDDVGDDANNIRLGQARANYLSNLLIKLGIDKSRITATSKGESEPVADNNSEAGRQRNRRAVLQLNKVAQE